MENLVFFLLFCNFKKLFTTDEYKMLNRRGRGSRQKSLYKSNFKNVEFYVFPVWEDLIRLKSSAHMKCSKISTLLWKTIALDC